FNMSSSRSDVRAAEFFAIFLYKFPFLCHGVFRFGDFVAEDYVDRCIGTHYCYFGRWPGKVHVGPDVLASKHVVGASIRLSYDYSKFGNRGFAVGVEEFGPMPNYPVVFLIYSRQEPGNIHQGQDRDVERIAESDEACRLDGGIDVQGSSVNFGLVCNDPNRVSVESGESDDDILSPDSLYLEQFDSLDDPGYDILDIVRLVRVVMQDTV